MTYQGLRETRRPRNANTPEGIDQNGRTSRQVPSPATRVRTITASSSPDEREPLAQLLGDDVDAALLDRQPADVALAQRRAQLLLAVGQLLEHLVAAGERRAERRVRGDVGEVLVDEPAVDAGRDRGHQAGPDDGAVRLVEELPDGRRRARPGRPPRSASPGRRSPITVARRAHVASRPDHSAASLTSPRSRDPLGLDARRARGRGGCPGAVFTQASRVSSDSTNDHGGDHLSVEKVRPRAVRRAGSANATSNPAWSIVGRVGDLDGAAEPEGGRLADRHRDPLGVEVDAGGGDARRRQRDQVAADAAAEVDDRRRAEGLRPGPPGAARPTAGWPARGPRA